MVYRFPRRFFALLALGISFSAAKADPITIVGDLASLGAAPAAMGGWHGIGAFGAQGLLSQSPGSDFQHFSITHTHSLRHFPGKKKNLDHLDADPISIQIPLNKGNSLLGATFSLSGELGYDHRNTNGVLKKKHWLRGKAREIFYAGIANKVATATSLGWNNTWMQEGDGPTQTQRAILPGAHMTSMGSGRWRWSFSLRRREPVEGKVKGAWLWSLGAAYGGKHKILGVVSILGQNLKVRRGAIGAEKSVGKHLKLRAGHGEGWTYGWGVRLGEFLLDYAVMKHVMPSLTTQPFPKMKDAHLYTYGFQF